MRGVWLFLPLVAGCQGGYPLAPTLCDDWCDVTERTGCFQYDPAACVLSCEEQGFSSAACAPETRAAVDCLRAHPNDRPTCDFGAFVGYTTCLAPVNNATTCTSAHSGTSGAP